jgi:signal transduction histidine kinase
LARAITASIEGKVSSEECRFERSAGDRNEQLDLFVWSKPLPFGDERYQLFAVVDISSEKRREILERIFLHDLMNTATSVSSLLHLIDSGDPSFDEHLELAQSAADQLTEEILAHRALRDAEQGQLAVERGYFSLEEAVSAVIRTYRRIADSRGIGFDAVEVPPTAAHTDPVLLKRVLANLLKNAIEPVPGETSSPCPVP